MQRECQYFNLKLIIKAMIKLLKLLFGKSKTPVWRCTYCGRQFDNARMAGICHDLHFKIKQWEEQEMSKKNGNVFGNKG